MPEQLLNPRHFLAGHREPGANGLRESAQPSHPLQIPAHDRQGRAQFMGEIGHEALLLNQSPFFGAEVAKRHQQKQRLNQFHRPPTQQLHLGFIPMSEPVLRPVPPADAWPPRKHSPAGTEHRCDRPLRNGSVP